MLTFHTLHGVKCGSAPLGEQVNGTTYLMLEKVGQGGSSQVFKVMGPKSRIFACKLVSLSDNDINNCRNEVKLLKDLRGKPNIIQLFAAEERDGYLFLIFEFGEIDLSRVLAKSNGKKMSENYLRMYWQQMLEAVQTIHEVTRVICTLCAI